MNLSFCLFYICFGLFNSVAQFLHYIYLVIIYLFFLFFSENSGSEDDDDQLNSKLNG